MAKPMTSEQIENELNVLTATVRSAWLSDGAVTAPSTACKSALRAAFTLGQDNGSAVMLERADSIIAPRFADEKTAALGAAVTHVIAWAALVKGRSWAPQSQSCLLFAADQEPAIDPIDGATGRVRFFYGADTQEAITVAATWCTEHTKNSAPKVPDTLPAPADESQLAEIAENGAASDAWDKTHGDTEAFGGSDF